jgi:hypothetical protein
MRLVVLFIFPMSSIGLLSNWLPPVDDATFLTSLNASLYCVMFIKRLHHGEDLAPELAT